MKTPELTLFLWAIGLLLLGRGQGSPIPEGKSDTAHRPSIVWRGESTQRGPKDVEEDGGFWARGEGIQELTKEQMQEGSSLEQHVFGQTLPYTKFVSTSSEPKMALEFADEFERGPNYVWFGYLYKIAADWKMIDLEDSLKHRYRGAHRKEQSAVIGIPFEQIIGWYDLRKVGPEWGKNTASVTERLKKGETLDGFVNNEHFDPRYLKTRGAGGKPQLAGFHPDDDLWNSEPWNKFPGHSAPEALKKYIQENYDPEIDDERIWKWAVEPQSQEADRMANMEAQRRLGEN
ncbi:putative enterotoxin [Ophiocordyceps australis]|uniref:Putative enterotoxin n=1 Tax=Ophiocordyceps australis TaxID=1399860 RepID=A0A2C5XMN5_9HYPO|nr:putative enterotoxin [Ophiocordyceps australis]